MTLWLFEGVRNPAETQEQLLSAYSAARDGRLNTIHNIGRSWLENVFASCCENFVRIIKVISLIACGHDVSPLLTLVFYLFIFIRAQLERSEQYRVARTVQQGAAVQPAAS